MTPALRTGRAKRLRRVVLLGAAVAAVSAVAVQITRHKQAGHDAELQALRRAGMNAYAAGDLPGAIKSLDRYTAERGDDDAALLAFAVARSGVEAPGGQNLTLAIQKLNQVLAHPGDHPAARRAMIELLTQTTDTARLDDLITDALTADPADAVALRARVTVRLRQDRPDDALAAARAFARAKPDDVPSRLTILQLMQRVGRPPAEIVAFADAQFAAADPRHALLRADADAAAGDADGALAGLRLAAQTHWLQAAPERVGSERVAPERVASEPAGSKPAAALAIPADTTLVAQFVDAFDGLKRFDESTRLLEAALRHNPDPRLARSLALRLWEQGHADRVLAGLPGGNFPDPAVPATDPTLLAVRAMACFEGGRTGEARAIVARLTTSVDRVARGWALALPARYATAVPPPATTPDAAPAAASAAFEKALAADPSNGVVRAWLAADLAAAGEPVLALRQWDAAAEAQPTWAVPQSGRAAALAALGCGVEAVDAAQAAYDRSPGVAAAVELIDLRFTQFDRTPDGKAADAAAARDLLAATAGVQAARPGEPRTLAVRAALLCRLGVRDEAVTLVGEAVARRPDLARSDRLRAVDADEGLGVTALDPAAPPPSAETLARRADARPDSVDAQRVAIDAAFDQAIDGATPAASADPAFVARAIDRLHALTGDDGRQWRLYHARTLAAGPDPAEAVTVLSDLVREAPRQVRPRVELARALQRTGNAASAIEHLKLARAADPQSVDALVPLVTMLRDARRGDEAAALLRRLAAGPAMPPRTTRAVAELCLAGGDTASVVAMLGRPAAAPSTRPLLADAFARQAAAQRQAGRWDDVRRTAAAWKKAVPAGAPPAAFLPADAAAAEADLATGDPAAADARLAPYADAIVADARRSPQAAVVLARVRLARGDAAAARAVVRPLLADAAGRDAVRQIARVDAPTSAAAAAWLNDADDALTAAPATAVGPAPERSAAAAAWAAVGRKFGDAATLETALVRANACLVDRPADGPTRMLRAGLLQQLGRTSSAEAALRSVLDVDPRHAAANNDLACLLLANNGDAAEAARRAAAAVEASPRAAAFYDTLARARLAQHDAKGAAAAFRDALRLDPKLAESRDGLTRLQTADTRDAE